jgi:hypothetical protein
VSELRDLREGELYLLAPNTMQVGGEEVIEARAGYEGDPALGAGLTAKSVPRIFDLPVSRVMRATLSGDKFKVEALTDEDQPFEGVGVVTWRWRIVPLEPGTQRLHLEVAALVRTDGRERGRSVGGVDHVIEVQVTPRWFFSQTTSLDWKTIGAGLAALGGAAAAVWGALVKRRGRRRRTRASR